MGVRHELPLRRPTDPPDRSIGASLLLPLRGDAHGGRQMTRSLSLDFEIERDRDTTSFDRADPSTALIEQKHAHVWTVSLPDGEGTHHVMLGFEDDSYIGCCTCEGFEYHDGPCAHLCTIRKAHQIRYPDVNGTPIQVRDVDRDPDAAEADHYDDPEQARADGGRRVRR